ncbi:MAG: hypothetical protein AMJ91_06845 [candidate division Zixibacteria bacterium SM23_73_3]|nr:MAG: hypothetical protein AMJ91_06845 [candidate division Zixibacteria bacterium SM23_73_3]
MDIYRRNTYQSGADRMLFDHCWQNCIQLDKIQVGDIIRVKAEEKSLKNGFLLLYLRKIRSYQLENN